MHLIFQQYGKYIIAVLSTASVIAIFTLLLGITQFENLTGYSGNGLIGQLVCLLLNRIC